MTGIGIGCSAVVLTTQDGHRQVGIGQIGVGSVMVVTPSLYSHPTPMAYMMQLLLMLGHRVIGRDVASMVRLCQ